MLNNPVIFFTINIILTYVTLVFKGFSSIYYVMGIICLVIIFTNVKKIGLINSISLCIIYLLIFDSKFFSFTKYNFRIWYFLEIPLLCYYLIKAVLTKRDTKINCISLVTISFLLLLTVIYFFIDPIDGKLSIIKYLFFSVGTIYVLVNSLLSITKQTDINKLINFFISLGLYVCIWGIIQYFSWGTSYHKLFQFDYFNQRPSAFFSETTWYSEYIFFTLLLLSYYQFFITNKKGYFFLIFPCLFGILLSSTRNAYLAFAVVFLVTFIADIYRGYINKKVFLLIFFVFCLFFAFLVITNQLIFIQKITNRFSNGDSGRLTAFKKSILLIKEELFFGHGFSFNSKTDVAGVGSYIGAKSFNFFLMITHILGLFGITSLLVLITNFFIRLLKQWKLYNSYYTKLALTFISCFLSMSMFAPIHQYPFGMFIVSVSLYFFYFTENQNIQIKELE